MGVANTANPRIWQTAKAYAAPVGTTAPTDIATAWAAAWLEIGLLHEDGMTESREADENDFYAWGGILIRTARSKHKRTLTIAVLEDNLTVFGLLHPGSATSTTTGITTRLVKVPTPDPRAFGFELVDGTVTSRLVVPRGEIVGVGDLVRSDNELSSKELTINVYPASDGLLYREITNDAQANVA